MIFLLQLVNSILESIFDFWIGLASNPNDLPVDGFQDQDLMFGDFRSSSILYNLYALWASHPPMSLLTRKETGI
jgi:hypothetical protein